MLQWMERERQKLGAQGEVTSAASGSRIRKMEAQRWSSDAAPAIKEVNPEVSPKKEKSKQLEEVATRKDAPSIEAKGGFVMCDIEGEQRPVRVKAPPQKRTAVIRVEPAETQDDVPGQQGFERT